MKKFFLLLVISTVSFAEELRIYSLHDYISEEVIKDFEKKTGITVIHDAFDNNDDLESKLLSSITGYDIVIPSSQFLSRQVKNKVYHAIDKKRLKNYSNLDKNLLSKVAINDPNNEYSVPYLWGTVGIGYNVDKIKEKLNIDKIDSWDIFFKKENISKLKDCGVASIDTDKDVIAAALHYLNKNPNSSDEKIIKTAEKELLEIRPYISYFHNSKFISDLENGNICMVLGWSGEILQAKNAAIKKRNGVNIAYSIPKEGAGVFFDVIAIPKASSNVNAAYKFIDYILEPQVIASLSNKLLFLNSNEKSLPLLNQQLKNDINISPKPEMLSKLYLFKEKDAQTARMMKRLWNKIKH